MACRICKVGLIAISSAASGSAKTVKSRGEGQPTFYSEGTIYCPSCGVQYMFDPDGDTLKLLYAYDSIEVRGKDDG